MQENDLYVWQCWFISVTLRQSQILSLRIPLLAMVRVDTGIAKKLKSPGGTGNQINSLVPKDQKVKKTPRTTNPCLSGLMNQNHRVGIQIWIYINPGILDQAYLCDI